MTGRSTGWRLLGRLLAALVLTVLTLGPSLDRIICRDDARLSAAAAAAEPVAVENAREVQDSHDDDLGTCIHGHCHHAAPYVPADNIAPVGPVAATERHEYAPESIRTSDLQFGLKRPPRG